MQARLPLLGLLAAAALAAGAPPAAGDEFFFRDGDRVVMMGDSITEQHLYSNYVEMWTVSRFPSWRLTFRNVGIGGDRSTGGNGRFQRDVAAYKPTALTVDFGMNDGNYRAFDEPGFKTYVGGLKGIAEQAKTAGIRVAWVTPQPIEKKEDGPALEGYNETLEKYSAGVRQVAAESRGLFVDQFHPYLVVLNKARTADPKNRVTGGDPVHPGPPGQALMAASILKGLNFPGRVSAVAIDVSRRYAEGDNCKVSGVEYGDGSVTFQRLDRALPFFPPDAKGILAWTPLLADLNKYELKVKGLPSGRYEVRLGGKKVAEHDEAELAHGVNLAAAALEAGPVADQVKAVWNAVQAKNRFFHDRIFRGIILAGPPPDFLDRKEYEARKEAALKERLEKMPELDEAVRRALEMKPYRVEVVPAAK